MCATCAAANGTLNLCADCAGADAARLVDNRWTKRWRFAQSDCAVEQEDSNFKLTKSATVLSCGASADGILTTARRTPDSPATDQVFVALYKKDYKLHHLVDWDTLGMRGTCSTGFTLESSGAVEQIFPEPYHKIHSQTVMPVANLTWAAVWAGIAADAVERARLFTRKAARKSGDKLPPGAAHVTRASASLTMLRSTIKAALNDYEAIMSNGASTDALEFQIRTNLLKVNASELAISIVTSALRLAGFPAIATMANSAWRAICVTFSPRRS